MVAVNGVEESAAADGIGYGSSFQDLKFTWTDAATITAGVADKAVDETAHILMFDSEGNPRWFEFTGTQAIAITTDGVNGLETTCYNTEGEESDHNYHVYAVGTAGGTVGFLMVDDDDYAGGPFTAGGGSWDPPAGYTYVSRPAHYLRNDGSGDLIPSSCESRFISYTDYAFTAERRALNAVSLTSFTDVTANFRKFAPEWASSFNFFCTSTTGSRWYFSQDGTNTTEDFYGEGSKTRHVEWPAASHIYYRRATGSGSISASVTGVHL